MLSYANVANAVVFAELLDFFTKHTLFVIQFKPLLSVSGDIDISFSAVPVKRFRTEVRKLKSKGKTDGEPQDK